MKELFLVFLFFLCFFFVFNRLLFCNLVNNICCSINNLVEDATDFASYYVSLALCAVINRILDNVKVLKESKNDTSNAINEYKECNYAKNDTDDFANKTWNPTEDCANYCTKE